MGRVKALAMALEDEFIDAVSTHIGGCEHVDELIATLEQHRSFDLIKHLSNYEQCEFATELWNDYWLEKG